MQSFNELKYFERFVKDTAKDEFMANVCYLCEVKSFNENFSVDVVIKGSESMKLELSDVPILQSAYVQPFCQTGDWGIVMPLNSSIYPTLIDKDNLFALNEREYLFLPIVAKKDALQGGGDVLGIKSPLGDVVNIGSGEIECKTTELNLTATAKLSATANEIELSATNGVTITDAKKASIEAPEISIKSTSPLEIGASDTLGTMLSDLISALSGLTTTNAVEGAPCSLGPDTIAKLTEIQAKIKVNFK